MAEQAEITEEVNAAAQAPDAEVEAQEAPAAAEVGSTQYTVDDVQAQIKPESQNAFLRFFQKIGRWWLGVWYGFCEKHPKASPWIYKLFFFFVFSMGVTILQALIMLFLPKAFTSITGAFAWPGIQVGDLTWHKPIFDSAGKLTGEFVADVPATFAIFGDDVLGNWIAFEIAVFVAQCINFPLQRNITYRSHGNPWYQAMWYFIGWVGISFLTGAIWGIIDPLLKSWGWFYTVKDGVIAENGVLFTLATLLKTFITGGVSMIIFFPIFLIIFPDNVKMAKNARAKYDKLVAANADAAKIAAAKTKAEEWEYKAAYSTADKEASQAVSQASTKALRYNAAVKAEAQAKADYEAAQAAAAAAATEKDKINTAMNVSKAQENYEMRVAKTQALLNDAFAAIDAKTEKLAAFEQVKAQAAAA